MICLLIKFLISQKILMLNITITRGKYNLILTLKITKLTNNWWRFILMEFILQKKKKPKKTRTLNKKNSMRFVQ